MLYNAFCSIKNAQSQSRINNIGFTCRVLVDAALFCVKSKQFLTNFKSIKRLPCKTQYVVVESRKNNICSKVLTLFQNTSIISKKCVSVLTFLVLSYIIDT